VRVDDAMRPFQVWRHELGTDPGTDALVYQEDDPEFFVSVDRSRDNRVVLISCGSKTTSETLFLPADQPLAPAVSVAERRHGIEYGVDHWNDSSGDGWWIKISNEGATDFFLSARRVTDETSGWSVLIPERPGQRLDGVEAFSHCLLVSERSDGCAALRMIPLAGSHDLERGDLLERSSLIPGPATPSSVVAGDNANFETDMLRIVTTSMIHPRNIIDIDIASGDQIVRKVQKVKGAYRTDDYTTGRLWVTASDGERVPVTVVARRELLAVAGDELQRGEGQSVHALRIRQLRDLYRPVLFSPPPGLA
jgi:oligopeptidase B